MYLARQGLQEGVLTGSKLVKGVKVESLAHGLPATVRHNLQRQHVYHTGIQIVSQSWSLRHMNDEHNPVGVKWVLHESSDAFFKDCLLSSLYKDSCLSQ